MVADERRKKERAEAAKRREMRTGPINTTVVVAAIVALIGIGGGVVAIASVSGSGGQHIGTLFTLVGPTIVSLIALLRIEQTRTDIQNGLVRKETRRAINESELERTVENER